MTVNDLIALRKDYPEAPLWVARKAIDLAEGRRICALRRLAFDFDSPHFAARADRLTAAQER